MDRQTQTKNNSKEASVTQSNKRLWRAMIRYVWKRYTSNYISSSNIQISLSITVTNNHRITRKQLKEIKMK